MFIPLVDLRAQYREIGADVDAAMRAVLESGNFVRGPAVEAFERSFAEYCEARHCVGVGNGTDALELALEAVGVGPGREVVTAVHTFVATAEAVVRLGGAVRFVDAEPDGWGLDVSQLEEQITGRTAALLPVHLFGHPVDVGVVNQIGAKHGVAVVEDAAQAHGARVHGRRVGALGDAGCFSFYPAKNLGAFGDGGAVVTNDDRAADLVRMRADHGRRDKYLHLTAGRNSRLDALQAAVLLVKLRRLDQDNERRRALAARYREHLTGVPGLSLPSAAAAAESVYHLFVVAVEERDGLRRFLEGGGIATGVHYPVPLHLQPAFRSLPYARGDFPHAERLASTMVTLPLYPGLAEAHVDLISGRVRDFLDRG